MSSCRRLRVWVFFSEVPFGELFWKVRDFVSILFAILHERMPHARVYHAHTTGYAALIAAAAARDHGTSFLLTEHNLYIRDTVNTKLERNMAKPRHHRLRLPQRRA